MAESADRMFPHSVHIFFVRHPHGAPLGAALVLVLAVAIAVLVIRSGD